MSTIASAESVMVMAFVHIDALCDVFHHSENKPICISKRTNRSTIHTFTVFTSIFTLSLLSL